MRRTGTKDFRHVWQAGIEAQRYSMSLRNIARMTMTNKHPIVTHHCDDAMLQQHANYTHTRTQWTVSMATLNARTLW